jgi:6-pyruvoyltetrahydropterin/6-carboxytetrahydropterin synthase
MKISKIFKTETSHIVRDAVYVRCRETPHGHSYKWIVTVEGPVQSNGMVIDFKELSFAKDFIDLFDHSIVFWSKEDPIILEFFLKNFKRVLVMNKNTTAENMAKLVFKSLSDIIEDKFRHVKLVQVDVWETENSYASATYCDEEDTFSYIHKDQS